MVVDWLQDKYIRAGQLETSVEELWMLAIDDIDNVRRRVAENCKSPPELLASLAEDENAEVRVAVAENPQTPAVLLQRLAVDGHADVRYSIAENPNMPEEILVLLCDDDNPYVSHRAQITLRMVNPIEPARWHRRSDYEPPMQSAESG